MFEVDHYGSVMLVSFDQVRFNPTREARVLQHLKTDEASDCKPFVVRAVAGGMATGFELWGGDTLQREALLQRLNVLCH